MNEKQKNRAKYLDTQIVLPDTENIKPIYNIKKTNCNEIR